MVSDYLHCGVIHTLAAGWGICEAAPVQYMRKACMTAESKRKVFDIVSLALAVVALVIAIVHLTELDKTVQRLENIQDGLSTRYLGNYPAFFRQIVKVVGSAQKNLVIVCDFPAYGSFSEPSTFEDYSYAIKKRRQFVNLEVT